MVRRQTRCSSSVLGVDNHVIQVDQGVREVQLPQTILHEVLECCWSVTQTVGHAQKLVNAHAAHRKGSVLPGLLSHFNLPEPTIQVHTRKLSGTHHALHGFLHTRQGIGILLGSGIQAAEVDTKPERPNLLPHQYHGITPQRLGWLDGTAIQHFLNVLAHLIHQGRSDTAKSLFEWCKVYPYRLHV